MKLIGKTFKVGVFSRGVPINQVLFTSCIDICLIVIYKFYKLVHVVICLQVGTRCLCVVICLQVHVVICLQVHVVVCLQVVTRVYNVLQVHVSPRSEMT